MSDNCVNIIMLDTDASGGTSDETADGIDVSLSKLDSDKKESNSPIGTVIQIVVVQITL